MKLEALSGWNMDTLKYRIGNHVFSTDESTLIMGILNVTPDSFSDGGLHNSTEIACEFVESMLNEGSDIIDVGGESTRPGAEEVDSEEEWQRVGEIIKRITKLNTLVSIDTYKSEIAKRALELGVQLVNDVWGLQRDSNMADTVAESDSAVVVMHNRLDILPDNELMPDIHSFFEKSLKLAAQAGIRKDGIILDPGIGFGKSPEQNSIVLRNLNEFKKYGHPILIGLSRKRFIGNILGLENPKDRLYGTIGANIIALANGADILRVHDVKANVEAVRIADSIIGKRNQ